jgi:hypothetical protein
MAWNLQIKICRGRRVRFTVEPAKKISKQRAKTFSAISAAKSFGVPATCNAPHAEPPAQAKEYYARTEARVPEICPSKPSKHLNKTA